MIEVTLYTKPGCHLCEPVRKTIEQAAETHAVRFVERNVLEDPADYERYKHAIPVVVVNGKEIARFRLTRAHLLASLESADRGESCVRPCLRRPCDS